MHKISIEQLQNGAFEVMAGCQRFFYLTKESAVGDVLAYFNNPNGAERAWSEFNNRIADKCVVGHPVLVQHDAAAETGEEEPGTTSRGRGGEERPSPPRRQP